MQIESIVNECVEHILTIAYRNHPYSLASIQQYLFLKEEEIYKITTALECIRYGLSQRETLQYLVQKANDVKEVMHHDRKDEILKHFRTEN